MLHSKNEQKKIRKRAEKQVKKLKAIKKNQVNKNKEK